MSFLQDQQGGIKHGTEAYNWTSQWFNCGAGVYRMVLVKQSAYSAIKGSGREGVRVESSGASFLDESFAADEYNC